MKVCLLLESPSDFRSGYVCIDPFAPDRCDDGRVKGAIDDLSPFVDAAEATELVAHDVLDYFPGVAVDGVLEHWLSRLARGGTLSLSVVDVREVARGIIAGTLSIDDVNELLHGRQASSWDYRKSSFTLSQLVAALERPGFRVLRKRVQNYRAVVTVERTN